MGTPLHIKTFKEQKKPRSANEMAAVVAYYLGNVTAAGQRKGTVNQRDILVAHTMPRGGIFVLDRGTPGTERRKRKATRSAKRRSP